MAGSCTIRVSATNLIIEIPASKRDAMTMPDKTTITVLTPAAGGWSR
ncbi:MAG: hypothetical protein ACLR23_04395 [Clostridia bacterium]